MTDPCLDAEVLAAWADHALDARAAAEVEAHASQCPRCQAMLAAFVRTEPAAAPSLAPELRPWSQGFRLRWLVPVAAAATAVAIWVAVPTRPAPQTEIAGNSEASQRQEADATFAAPVDPAVPPVDPAVPGVTPPLAKEGAPAPREDAAASRDEAPRVAALKSERTDEQTSSAQGRPAAEAPPAAAAPSAAGAVEPRERSAPLLPALADTAVSTIQGFVSRDGSARWRVVGATVERSADNGATWTAASLSGVATVNEADRRAGAAAPATPAASVGAAAPASPARVVAGDAPSAAVCWLVGTRGAVWITTDGGQVFRRLTVPGEPDLDAVTARDDRSADVTASDGRVRRTSDGGANWTLIAP